MKTVEKERRSETEPCIFSQVTFWCGVCRILSAYRCVNVIIGSSAWLRSPFFPYLYATELLVLSVMSMCG
jgi:hypothetical protein